MQPQNQPPDPTQANPGTKGLDENSLSSFPAPTSPQPNGPVGQPAPLPAAQPFPSAPMTNQTVLPKNPGVAALASAVWTGAGQIYNGQILLGLCLMFIQFINILLMFILIGFLTGPLVWIIGIAQAYSYATSYNRPHGIVS